MKTVAYNKQTGRYGIYTRARSGDPDADPRLGTLIYEFPAGTGNNAACKAFDQYMRTGDLPEGD